MKKVSIPEPELNAYGNVSLSGLLASHSVVPPYSAYNDLEESSTYGNYPYGAVRQLAVTYRKLP